MNILHLPGLRSQTVEINDQDETDSTTFYYGFQSIENRWIIMTQINTSDTVKAYRYASNKNNPTITDYVTAWAGKTSLTYDYFVKIKP